MITNQFLVFILLEAPYKIAPFYFRFSSLQTHTTLKLRDEISIWSKLWQNKRYNRTFQRSNIFEKAEE